MVSLWLRNNTEGSRADMNDIRRELEIKTESIHKTLAFALGGLKQ